MRSYVDYHEINEAHGEIHGRLENWARSTHGATKASASPMFEGYQSPARVKSERNVRMPVDHDDARKLGAAIRELPEKPRKALHWCYVWHNSPRRGADYVECSLLELQGFVYEGRQRLIDAGV